MTVINHKSISGVTSITAPAGSDNLFTVHTNDTTERFRIDASGHQNISGIITATNFKTGTSNLHNTGLNIQDLDVDGHTNLDNVSIAGVTTGRGELRLTEGTSDVSQGAEIGSLMFLNPSNDNKNAKIAALRTTGTSGADLAFYTRTHGDATNNDGGVEKLRITSAGRVGIGTDIPAKHLVVVDNTGSGISVIGTNAGIYMGTHHTGGFQVNAAVARAASTNYHITNSVAGDLCIAAESTKNILFGTGPSAGAMHQRFKIKANGQSYFTGSLGVNVDAPSHNLHVHGTANTSGARFNIDHTGTTVSGNTASGAFPHNILVSNYNNSQPNNMATIGFDIPATTGSGAHANAVIVGQAEDGNGNCSLQFWTESGNTIGERLRIKSGGEVRIGANSTAASTAGDDLVIEGSSDRGLSIIAGTSSSSNIYFGDSGDADIGRMAYQHNDNALDFSVNAGTTRLRIHQSGIYVYGNDNYFYGGGGGTNLNGDLKIRSTGTAVYQSLKFLSSDGSSQSQILGYGGGAILFHYSNEFVWAINNQGERLNLTNTALTPRTNSTVLDLGTTGNRYRRTYTDGITVNTANTNTKFCINGGSSNNVMTVRNTTLGNGHVGILFSTQDHSGGREKAAIYHQDTHGGAHYGGDFVFCLNSATGGAAQVSISDEKFRIKKSGVSIFKGIPQIDNTAAYSSSTDTFGHTIQRNWKKNIQPGKFQLFADYYATEGNMALMIQVSSDTGGHSGTSTYYWQGGYLPSSGYGDSWHRILPIYTGYGHGDNRDDGLSSNAWELLIGGAGVTGNNYKVRVAVHLPTGRTAKNISVTINEMRRGMEFTDQSSNTAGDWSTQTDSGSDAQNHVWSKSFITTNTPSGDTGGNYNYRRNYLSSNQHLYWYNGANQAYLHLNGSWTNASDIAYKKDIEEITYGIETVKQIKPRKYKHKGNDENDVGFIAQELETVVPEVVSGEEGGKGVSYGNLTAVLTKALQEAIVKIETLEAKVAILESS